MADTSLASLKAQPTGRSPNRLTSTKVAFVPTKFGNSGPNTTIPAENNPNFNDPAVAAQQVRLGGAKPSVKASKEQPQLPTLSNEQIYEILDEARGDPKDAIASLNKKYYNDKPPQRGEEGYDDYVKNREALKAARMKDKSRQKEEDAETTKEDDNILPLVGGGAVGAKKAEKAAQNMAANAYDRHLLRRRRGRRTPEEAAKRKRLEEKAKRRLEAKQKLHGGAVGRNAAAEGKSALTSGEAALKGGERALKGGKSVVKGLETVTKGSKLLRFGAALTVGAAGFVVGTAALVGGIAVIGGAAVGWLAYKYGKASGEKSLSSALNVGGKLLVPQEARDKFSQAGDDFKKGDLWGAVKNGVKGCDEVLGISSFFGWAKDQAVDFAKDPKAKMQSIASGVKTGVEVASVLAKDSNLLDKTLTVAGNMAAGNDETQSMVDLRQAAIGNKDAVALAQRNPEMFGFGAVPQSAIPAQPSQMVTKTSDAVDDERYGVASTWVPEPDAG
ncbi:MAG: hypothetical protein ABTQ34_08210 [Bdellovibrionales bacterium]